eukprot:comp22339_c0_seq14/m.53772 comp22339_c0_seq14/g.53772  ORF comp22339_c0_seq14/g.53772 comp22339_c0_seq14/m.53772 type:complete len:382 (+) comp22339_c0_seq14:1574-2719(+)
MHNLDLHVLDLGRKVLQMPMQERPIDVHQRARRRQIERKHNKVALQARIDVERARRRVHRAQILCVVDLLEMRVAQLLAIVPVAIVDVLAHQRDRRLRVVQIEHRHVEIVHKIDKILGAGRTIVATSLLLERRLKRLLQRHRVRVVVERNRHKHTLLGRHLGQQPARKRGLAAPRGAHKHHRTLVGHQLARKECNRGGLCNRNIHRTHLHLARVKLNLFHNRAPRHKAVLLRVDKHIKHTRAPRELDRLVLVLPPVREVRAVVNVVLLGQRRAKRPHRSKHKVRLERHRIELLLANVVRMQQPFEDVAQRLHHVEVENRHNVLEVLGQMTQRLRDILVEKLKQLRLLVRSILARRRPGLDIREPLRGLGHENDARARHRGR